MTGWRGAVEMVKRASSPKGRALTGLFSIEGTRLHERALRAGIHVEQAVVATGYREASDARVQGLLAALEANGCELIAAPDAVVAEMTGGRDLGAILGLIRMPAQPVLADVVAQSGALPVLLVAVNVAEPGNVGALVRTAHALGAAGFVAVGASDPFHPKALRTTMGSLFKLPVLRYGALPPLLAALRELGVEAVGTAVSGGVPLYHAEFGARGTAVLMGSEAWGLSEAAQARVDRLVSIPMAAGIDSLSVNAAAAVILYELARRRLQAASRAL